MGGVNAACRCDPFASLSDSRSGCVAGSIPPIDQHCERFTCSRFGVVKTRIAKITRQREGFAKINRLITRNDKRRGNVRNARAGQCLCCHTVGVFNGNGNVVGAVVCVDMAHRKSTLTVCQSGDRIYLCDSTIAPINRCHIRTRAAYV